MNVAVIGAAGFIGNRLVEQLHLGGTHSVIPIVRSPSRLALPARFAVDWRIGDALQVPSLAAALTGCDAVVHVALGDPRQIEAMPAVLAAAAASAGVKRVVYLSTASVHGQAPEPGTDEKSPLSTRHAMDYNNAKVRAERIFFRECQRHHLDGFALRPGVVYGPRSRWISDVADDLRTGRAWLLHDGSGICNGISVDNLCGAIIAALGAPASVTGAYLVGDEETVTWRDFYRQVAAGLGLDGVNIPTLTHVPAFRRTAGGRFRRLLASRGVQRLLPLLPGGLKSTTRQVLAAMQEPPRPGAWRLPEVPGPRITEELALLQQCRWRLPHARAAAQLGYRPRLTFSEAMARSLAWLAFAEGRLDLPL